MLPIQDSVPSRRKVDLCHTHAAFSERHQPSFRTDSLDVRPRKVVLVENELFEVDVGRELHARRMKAEDVAFGLVIPRRKCIISRERERTSVRYVSESGIENGSVGAESISDS